MVRPVVQHVAALTECAQILWPIVGRIAVQVRRCEHDARHPKPSCLHKVGPAGRPSSAIAPCRRLLVEPAPVRWAAEEDEVWPATPLAPALSALEADVAAQLAPMRGIERSQLRADWHRSRVALFAAKGKSGRARGNSERLDREPPAGISGRIASEFAAREARQAPVRAARGSRRAPRTAR